MDRLKILATALLCLAVACSKIDGGVNVSPGDDITVSVEGSDCATKTVLSEGKTPVFSSGDLILVYDNSAKKATYKYRTKQEGKFVFQKVSADEGFDKTKIVSAFYPADKVTASSKDYFTADFGEEQTFADNSFPKGSAPMTWFGTAGNEIKFVNRFGVVRFAFKYDSAPTKPIKLGTVALSSTSSKLYGSFKFTQSAVSCVSGGGTTVKLTGCEAGGQIGTDEKYYHIAVPGIAIASEVMNVKVTPTTEVPFGGSFTATNGSAGNRIVENVILQMNPFILIPVTAGGFSVADWTSVGKIKVGQITLSKTEVTLSVDGSENIQINGVTDWTKIATKVVSGESCFGNEKSVVGDKYYIRVTGTSAGTGRLFVNDQVTNSGSYIDITVTE
ncbi:MAG: hypothetical protein MJY69_02270 [Bacteroidales bacterium]|nr:hypothetical protein [Bacteroidales bacterium]